MTAPDTQPSQQPSGATGFAAGADMRSHRFGNLLRSEPFGGALLLLATVLALIAANAPALRELYEGVRQSYLGFSLGSAESPWLDLELSIGHWAADGLLAVFFFMVGLELKREFVTGELRDPGKALVPVAAAAGGVIVPALMFVGVVSLGGGEALGGWAVPTATDIAFATAILAIVGTHLPLAMRTFLLTLAVVDDLIAITIIAVFYTSDLSLVHLGAAVIPLALFALVAYKGQEVFAARAWTAWAVLLPLGLITWALFYNSGVHATIAGVILAFLIPVRPPRGGAMASSGLGMGLAEHLEHRVRPISAVICVPVFAFFSAGVFVGGWSGLTEAWTSATALGVILGLVVGKTIGITGTTFLVTRLRSANLDPGMQWIDVVGLASLAGIGFTVSLLISELSFGQGSELDATAKVGILTGSVLAAVLGGGLLSLRNRHYRALKAGSAGADDIAAADHRA